MLTLSVKFLGINCHHLDFECIYEFQYQPVEATQKLRAISLEAWLFFCMKLLVNMYVLNEKSLALSI